MHKALALAAVAATGATFLVSGLMGLPQDPADLGGGLKATIVASAAAFMVAVVIAVFVAWPKPRAKD